MKTREIHNGRHTKLYEVWKSMRARCSNPNNKRYDRYGGRGITVCKQWDDSFSTFREWAYSSGYHDGLTIERLDNDKGYYPDNCTWCDLFAQANNRCNNHILTINGQRYTIKEASKAYGIGYNTLRSRISRGWDDEVSVAKKDALGKL